MNKSKLNTIIIIISLLLYYLFSQLYLLKLGKTFTLVINPLVWISIAILLKLLVITPRNRYKFKETIVKYVIVAILLYALVYFVCGVWTGVGKGAYLQGFGAVINNLYTIGVILLCKEYLRYKLINNISKRDRKIVFILIVIVFSILDIKFSDIIANGNGYYTNNY